MNLHLTAAAALALLLAACSAPDPRAPGASPTSSTRADAAMDDPFIWLEDIHGERALAWVEQENARTATEFTQEPGFDILRGRLLEVLDSTDRIPMVEKLGPHYYNFWKDAEHPLGLWRRTTPAEYAKAEPAWETVLDLDALSAAEGTRWVWQGAQCLKPGYQRCLLQLSPGGGDAKVIREFDLERLAFVEGGFEVPEAKNSAAWVDADHLFVATDFGPGSMTTSSYARTVRLWQRGTPLASARLVYEGRPEDMLITAYRDLTPGFEREFVVRVIDFYTSETFLRSADGTLGKIDIPLDANASAHREWLLIEPRTDWTVGGQTFPGGSLLAARFDDFMAGQRALIPLFTPTGRSSLAGYSWTRNHLILNLLEDVASRQEVLTPGNGEWARAPLGGTPELAASSASGIDADDSDDYFLTVTGYLTPTTLYQGRIGGEPEVLKQSPAFFDASGMQVSQHFATSKDGTRVPYFMVAPRGLKHDGNAPTVLYGYGGFEIALRPGYNAVVGRAWLERGGVYVVANIRGGGEYGPRWHQAALKENRHRAYEDFVAVARDLVQRKVTTPQHLGAVGGSNGGLLVGNMLTLYPQDFGAIVSLVPLLDMRRYTRLSAGTSWIAEYGDPDDPAQWDYIRTFSPYHNLEAGTHYPKSLFYTATSDDRVGPVQARKMAARMQQMDIADTWFYENTEGGHGGAADNRQVAFMNALTYTFLWDALAPRD